MEISFIHLSDIHFAANKNVVSNRNKKIFDSIKNELKSKDALFIVTSGDIAYSGKESEYKVAKQFYNDLYTSIKDYTSLLTYLIFVPGNHDCDFDENKEKIRGVLLKEFSQNGFEELTNEAIDLCCEPQKHYFEFIKGKKKNGDIVFDNKLLTIKTFDVGGKIIKFNCYNSSWHSRLRETIGTMGFPIEHLYDKIPVVQNDLSISIVHHPFNWQTLESSKQFRDALARTSDIIISGHEHSDRTSTFSDLANEYETIHIESGALQETYRPQVSAFNLINIDLNSLKLEIKNYSYNGINYELKKEETAIIHKEKKLKSKAFQIKKEFYGDIQNPGASYIHSSVDEIKLGDLYIPPFFNDVTITSEKKTKFMKFVNASDALLIKDGQKEMYKVIFGAEGSGKTALLKYYFLKYYNQGLYPIYISGLSINEVAIDKLSLIILKQFSAQYDELDSKYEELDFSKVVLMVDDLHRFKYKTGKPVLISNFVKLFNFIIFVGDELMQIESFTDKKNEIVEPFDSFDRYIICEFGPTLRNEIIVKWYRLGKDYLDNGERNDFFKMVDNAEDNISTIIGKNLIPAYPIYILSILQAMESGQQESSQNSLHAYYYEMLIKSYLRKSLDDKEDLGFYLGLCKEYFFFLFESKIRFSPIAFESFRKFLKSHEDKYNLESLNITAILEVLKKGRILNVSIDNNISVTYKYIYYFFVAKYLSDNIENANIKDSINKMAERVYRDEYSNIILFLTHLSKNSYIIDKLIEKSKEIFSTSDFARLESDVDFINNLQSSLPELVYNDLDVDDARQEDLQEKEALEAAEREFEINKKEDNDYDLNEDLNSIDVLAYLTKAMRTISILGLITKKNWGELIGSEKLQLAEETFLLGLRTLTFHFSMLKGSEKELVEHVKSIIHKRFIKKNLNKIEVQNITKNYVFMLCSSSTFGVLKNIINSIGSDKLSKTFDDIENKYPFNSIKIIKAGIELAHYNGFPTLTIEALKSENEKNPLGFSTLQNLVMDYLHMYDVTFDKKQKICSLLNIKMQEQRVIESTSKVKK